MKFWRSLITINTPESSRSFTLIISAIVSAIVGLCVCFAICWDVIHNNYVKTDLESMGIFMLCMGGYLAGGSVSKIAQFMGKRNPRFQPYVEEMNNMAQEFDADDEPTYRSVNKSNSNDNSKENSEDKS